MHIFVHIKIGFLHKYLILVENHYQNQETLNTFSNKKNNKK